jgi:hypothetical protein
MILDYADRVRSDAPDPEGNEKIPLWSLCLFDKQPWSYANLAQEFPLSQLGDNRIVYDTPVPKSVGMVQVFGKLPRYHKR